MTDLPYWIWQQPEWPHFTWQADALAPLLAACAQAQGHLLGMAQAIDGEAGAQNELDALLQNIITSSAIEGEQLNGRVGCDPHSLGALGLAPSNPSVLGAKVSRNFFWMPRSITKNL